MAAAAIHRIEVAVRPPASDSRGEQVLSRLRTAGFAGVTSVSVRDLYFIEGTAAPEDIARLRSELLVDPVVEGAVGYEADRGVSIEVTLLPGVTDAAAESLAASARGLGIEGIERIATGHCYQLKGEVSGDDLRRIAESVLVNRVVQTYSVGKRIAPPFFTAHAGSDTARVERIALSRAGDDRLLAISRERRLSLDLAEMQAIRVHYTGLKREPTDIELEMLAQTWSEHCVHKTFKAVIEHRDGDAPPRIIDGLLKTYIRAVTDKLAKPWVRSAFVDNAGILAFDDKLDIAFKVETHNHPSALEPFGGANTGVGGVVRDVIGVSARPIANTDVLCFGPGDLDPARLPQGVLHPRRIAEGVTAGIEDYGNKMGIPTVNGAFCYHEGYTANPLVFCGCLGVVPRGAHPRAAGKGDLVVVLGGRTGRDGLRGATFSSMEMGTETAEIAGASVQIGHPIHEKQVLEAVIAARDAGLYTAITDCGAGGLSSAVGEMAADLGAEVHLERVPLKYPGLAPWEVWLSEAQERMVLAVPPAHWPKLEAICSGLDVEATVLGSFTGDGIVHLMWGEQTVGEIGTAFLHDGVPRMRLKSEWRPPRAAGKRAALPPAGSDLTPLLLRLLARPGIRSSEQVVRRYDHEVQGGTVVKPFVGVAAAGPSDAAVVVPQEAWPASAAGPVKGVALSVGIAPRLGEIDPYAMAWAAVDEAFRNAVAVGADPDRIALLDNFCWGNPRLPDRLGALVRCCEGCHDAALAYGAPFVSGKDSLNNEYTGADGQKHAIPGTLLISAVGLVPDISRTVTSDLKAAGNRLYLLGTTQAGLAGSAVANELSHMTDAVAAAPSGALELYRALHGAIAAGLVRACHDCSEGGLAVALAEMAVGGGLGCEVRLMAGTLDEVTQAFGESAGRLVVEVAPESTAAFEKAMSGQPCTTLGSVMREPVLRMGAANAGFLINADVAALDRAFRGHVGEGGPAS